MSLKKDILNMSLKKGNLNVPQKRQAKRNIESDTKLQGLIENLQDLTKNYRIRSEKLTHVIPFLNFNFTLRKYALV